MPIVVALTGDLVHAGLAQSLARLGGNVTGLVDISPELRAKRLQLLTEVLPGAARIGLLWHVTNQVEVLDFEVTKEAALSLGEEVVSLPISGAQISRQHSRQRGGSASRRSSCCTTRSRLARRERSSISRRRIGCRCLPAVASSRTPAAAQLRRRHRRGLSAGGIVRPSNPAGRSPRRPADRAADEVRARCEFQDCIDARPRDPSRSPAARRRGDRVTAAARASNEVRPRRCAGGCCPSMRSFWLCSSPARCSVGSNGHLGCETATPR